MGAVACGAGVLALGALGRAAADRLGAGIVGGTTSASVPDLVIGTRGAARVDDPAMLDVVGPGSIDPGASMIARSALDVVGTIGALVLPLVAVVALAAIAAHVAQTRALWLPRREVEHAPALAGDSGARTRRAGLELVHAFAIGGVAVGWLFWAAPRLAALPTVPLATGALVLSALAALAIGWFAIGTVDALLRHAAVGHALRMTPAEKREDDRMASADPRWRKLARRLAREGDPRAQLAEATLLVIGDDAAIAIAFDPLRRPIPTRLAVGKGPRVTQLVALARRYRLPIHREPALAAILVGATGAVPEAQWPRLAELVAATRR